MPVVNLTRSTWLATTVRRADSFLMRLVGWLWRKRLTAEESLWLVPCKAVHTIGMHVSIDVIFLDRLHRVVALVPALPSYRISRFCFGAHSALEVPTGTIRRSRTQVGDQLELSLDQAASLEHLTAGDLDRAPAGDGPSYRDAMTGTGLAGDSREKRSSFR
jgi:uncharacterized membrane protein (UPF0127 family)